MSNIVSGPLLVLTLLSLLFSSISLIISLITFAVASLWLSVIAAVLTALYHTTVFIISWRRVLKATVAAPRISASYTWPSMICAAFILGTWVLALAVILETTILGDHGLAISEQNAPWNDAIQVAHSVALAIQVLAFSSVLIHCINNRGRPLLSTEQFNLEGQLESNTIYGDPGKSEGIRIFSANARPTPHLKALKSKPRIIGYEITPFPLDLVLSPTRPNGTQPLHEINSPSSLIIQPPFNICV